jgi:neutral ceramidase
MGVLNWFAVHGTSLNNTNRLISGDNRGVAGFLLEESINGPTETVLPGMGDFVAAFASSNLGVSDISSCCLL